MSIGSAIDDSAGELALLGRLAQQSLPLWDLPAGATARLINLSENATYLVAHQDRPLAVLRLHREVYNSRRAIECELEWTAALRAADAVPTPAWRRGRDGQAVQAGRAPGMRNPRLMVLFDYVPGEMPDESGDLAPDFRRLGGIAAGLHDHVQRWTRPEPFERLTWDLGTVFGPGANWGDWRKAPGVTPARREVLERAEARITARLQRFGRQPDRFGLIHADMRLANLIRGTDGQLHLIDFDDCGLGWYLYDFAAAVSFIETDPRLPDLWAAWAAGYAARRPLPADHAAEIDTLVMLRRLALLAWIGSHMEAPEPQALAPHFAEGTARLAANWLAGRGPTVQA